MPKHLFLLFFLFIGAAFKPQDDYATYCNGKFGFCIKYPKTFGKGEESGSGDGATFTSKDKKAEIRAWGNLAVEDLDKLEQQLAYATQNLNVTYKVVKDSWFVVSGTDSSGAVVYRKTVKKKIDYNGDKATPVFQTVRLSYPAAQQKNYEGYCKVIAKSF